VGYDIVLAPRPEDEGAARRLPLSPARLEQWAWIEAEVRRTIPGPVQLNSDDSIAQLHFLDTGLLVNLFAEDALVAFPPPREEGVAELQQHVRAAVTAVARGTGWPAWDPQTGAPFDGVVRSDSELATARNLGAERRSLRGRFRRWLVCGIVLFCISLPEVVLGLHSWRNAGVVLGPLYVANALRLRRRLTSPPGG
jgi:hypothetical protein